MSETPYFKVFGALAVLTAVELAVPSVLGKGGKASLAALLALAAAKALLVAMYFMHLKVEGRTIYLVVIVTILIVAVTLPPIAYDIGLVYGR